jgi:hypothetical protein
MLWQKAKISAVPTGNFASASFNSRLAKSPSKCVGFSYSTLRFYRHAFIALLRRVLGIVMPQRSFPRRRSKLETAGPTPCCKPSGPSVNHDAFTGYLNSTSGLSLARLVRYRISRDWLAVSSVVLSKTVYPNPEVPRLHSWRHANFRMNLIRLCLRGDLAPQAAVKKVESPDLASSDSWSSRFSLAEPRTCQGSP